MKTVTAHVESSYCQKTLLGGIAAIFSGPNGRLELMEQASEPIPNTTMLEFYAIERMLTRAVALGYIFRGDHVVIVMRSLPTLSVLRAMFPDSRVEGPEPILMPKRLQASIKDGRQAVDLTGTVSELCLSLTLRYVGANKDSSTAIGMARCALSAARAAGDVPW